MDPVTSVYTASFLFIFLWSFIRFYGLSRPYRAQLKLFWLLAFAYSFYYLLLFVLAVTFLLLASTEVLTLIDNNFGTKLKEAFEGSPELAPPLLSAAFLYKAHDIPFFFKLDTFMVDRLLSAHDLSEDFSHLQVLLETNDFLPSTVEFAANLKMMEDFDVFVSNPLEEPTDLHSGDPMTYWRKVSTLLRFCRVWATEDGDVNRAAQIAELFEEHMRRTGVALHLLRLKLSTETYQEIKHPIEQEKQEALILTSDELNRTTKLVSRYIIADYKKLVSAVSTIAAHLVIYSGPASGKRLEQLSEAGFNGLGSFREMTFHKIVFLLTVVFGISFVVLYGFFLIYSNGENPRLALTSKIATVYALSAMSGGMIGSSRRLMSSKETPWGWYLLAGILGWLAWFGVTMLLYLDVSDSVPMAQQIGGYFATDEWKKQFPWSILPTALAIGIAALSHRNPLSEKLSILSVRISDGLMLGLVLMLAAWLNFMLHLGWKTPFSTKSLFPNNDLNWITLLSSSGVLFVVAFVVGASVISLARSVARSGLATEPDQGS